MIKSVKLENVKNNIFFVANIMIFSSLINYYLVGTEIFTSKWLYSSFAVTFAYVSYSLIAENWVTFKDDDIRIKKGKEDMVRYMSIYTLCQALIVFIEEGIIEITFLWASKTFFTVAGYVIFDYIFSDLLLNLSNYHILAFDLVKIAAAELIGLLIIFEQFDFIKASDLIAYLFSYIIWSLFTKKLIPNN